MAQAVGLVKEVVREKDASKKAAAQNKSDEKEEKQMKILTAVKAPALSKEVRGKLPEIVQTLYDHQCNYKIDNKSGSVTFYPSPHLKRNEYGNKVFETEKFRQSNQLKHFLTKLGCKSIEAMNDWNMEIISKKDSFHGFARAMEIAYFDHYPLKIKVSHIWLLILHALSSHIDLYNNELRSKYVNHEKKKQLTVDRFNFVKGSRDNDWESVIDEFAQKIDENTKNNIAKIVENDFTVSTKLEQIASKVSLMSACKHYFSYVVRCGCGFPEITLDGNKQDWLNLKVKVSTLLDEKEGLMKQSFVKDWKPALFDILDKFIDCYDGKIDCLFWNSMVRRGRVMSGMMIPNDDPSNQNSYYSGWMNILFPYLNEMHRLMGGGSEGVSDDPDGNKSSFRTNDASFIKYTLEQYVAPEWGYSRGQDNPLKAVNGKTSSLKIFPIGLTNAPVILQDLNTKTNYNLKLAAGFVGVEQDKNTLQVSPKIGWFIAE